MTIQKITPLITVPAIEPVLSFWQALGFAVATEVPHEDALGFVILAKDGCELMYQSRGSVAADVPSLVDDGTRSVLFIRVDDVEAASKAVAGHPILVPLRDTFYGSREIFVRAPCGTAVGLAQFRD